MCIVRDTCGGARAGEGARAPVTIPRSKTGAAAPSLRCICPTVSIPASRHPELSRKLPTKYTKGHENISKPVSPFAVHYLVKKESTHSSPPIYFVAFRAFRG